jgi:hypothetical protein
MPRKKNIEKPELKFVRTRSTFDDLIGYVTYGTECVVIQRPLRIEIETIFDEGRQILSLQEYLPQSIIDLQEVEIKLDDIIFVSPVREEFYEQYEQVSEFFYNNVAKIRSPNDKLTDEQKEEVIEKTRKVVSILEAMANKKDKPVH